MTEFTGVNFEDLIASLPDPKRDKRPPAVKATTRDVGRARDDHAFANSLLDVKNDTEQRVKYVLTNLMGAHLEKDGDWVTSAQGYQFYAKKVADYRGGIFVGDKWNASLYVEVKGISPYKNFSFSRLDRANNPKQPSQQEKLQVAHDRGDMVWLALGWWDAVSGPVEYNGRLRWRKEDVTLSIALLQWEQWLGVYQNHKWRSLRQKDRHLLDGTWIVKGTRWRFCEEHWWLTM